MLYTIDLQIARQHGIGGSSSSPELLPYAVSYSTGGAKAANVSASAPKFAVT